MTEQEITLEQIAELRASIAMLSFIQVSIAIQQGADGDTMLDCIAHMQASFADAIEKDLRTRAGLEPRTEPRKPVIAWGKDWPDTVNWSGMPEN